MLDWATLEAAIQAWVSTASGVTTMWDGQGGSRPEVPYVTMNAVVADKGPGWTTHEDADPSVPEAELVETFTQVKELALSLRCFGETSLGTSQPSAILDSVMGQASLSGTRELLRAGGWVPARINPVLRIPGVIGGTVFEPRAQVQCFGNVNSQITGTATYVQIVKVTNNLTGVESTLDSEA